MTLIFELDIGNVELNQYAIDTSKVTYCRDAHTHRTNCSTWTTKVFGSVLRSFVRSLRAGVQPTLDFSVGETI